jgi:hypothetical protein
MPLIVALVVLPLAWWWGIATNGNILTITPFAICVGNCPLASSAQACILHLFQAYHSESIFNTTFPFERINHTRSGMIFQALHQGLQHPLKQNIPKCDSHYLSISV